MCRFQLLIFLLPERVFNLKFPQEYIQRPEKIAANQAAFRAFYQQMTKQ